VHAFANLEHRPGALDIQSILPQQQAEGDDDVGLVVGDEDARC
jgi:hypothetical protein